MFLSQRTNRRIKFKKKQTTEEKKESGEQEEKNEMQNTNSLSSLSALRKLEVLITAQQLNKQQYKDWTQATKWTKFWRAGWKEKWDSEHYHVIITVRAPETQCSHHSESKEAKNSWNKRQITKE